MQKKLILLSFLILSVSCSNDEIDEPVIDSSNSLQLQSYRPSYHFSVLNNWMNDPNGMVYQDGVYHLFYQHYPENTNWGPMHWGHATSTDLFNWEDKPIALYPDDMGWIYSGSAVVDKNNTAGFKTDNIDPLIAIYTIHHSITGLEQQGMAYSTDKGNTWVKYENNPIIRNPNIRDFRDPKAFWNETTKKWNLVLAANDHIKFYESENLKEWNHISDFGQGVGSHQGVWECPDLFPLTANDGKTKWVLIVSVGNGALNGGSGTQYFVGDYDGSSFVSNQSKILWLDEGKDNYAGVTYNNIQTSDSRRIFIGWMSNWIYAGQVPTGNWRGVMTTPRELSLNLKEDGYRLSSKPIQELDSYFDKLMEFSPAISETGVELKDNDIIKGGSYMLEFNVDFSKASTLNIKIGNKSEYLSIEYNSQNKKFFINRSHSGRVDFNGEFRNIISSSSTNYNGTVPVKILVDQSSLELFVNDGETSMTTLFYPKYQYSNLSLYSSDSLSEIKDFTIVPILKSLNR
jgi:sucrose-6-phosphate hydrolase SacC (GH32 family)